MPKSYSWLLLIIGLLGFAGCREETAEPLDFAADYALFPLELDRGIIYAVDSIVIFRTTGGVRYDTSRYEARETLVETFTDASGRDVFRGERWRRADDGEDWTFEYSFTTWRTAEAAFREEDNLRFTKLVFPVRLNRSWDAHAAFDEDRSFVVGGEFVQTYRGWRSRYLEVDQNVSLPTGIDFDEATRVRLAADTNLIDIRAGTEIYAPEVGLVARTVDARSTQCNVCCTGDFAQCTELPWDAKAEKGFKLNQYFLRFE